MKSRVNCLLFKRNHFQLSFTLEIYECRFLRNVGKFPPLTASHFRRQFRNSFLENHKSDIINPVSYSFIFSRPLGATASPTRKKGRSSNSQVYNRQEVASLPAVNKSCFFLQDCIVIFACYVCSGSPEKLMLAQLNNPV